MSEDGADDKEGAEMNVEASEEDDIGVERVDSEKDCKGGIAEEEAEDADEDGAVFGRSLSLRRDDLRRLSAVTMWLTNSGLRGEDAVDEDDTEASDAASPSPGERGTGQCGRSRTHNGETRMDRGRVVRATSSEFTDSPSTSQSFASRHSDAAAYDQRSSSSLSLY